MDYLSWGRFPRVSQDAVVLGSRQAPLPIPAGKSVLPFGLGRSYGDSCLNAGNTILITQGLNKFIDFDPSTGVLRAEAGVSLAEIVRVFLPRGWFLPVSPGTKFVTLGGAIANDIHGKNHHCEGTFGRHVRSFELLRSDGSRPKCTPTENSELYAATIGGLGLTGLITWAEVQLKAVPGPFLETETVKFRNLDEFFDLSEKLNNSYEYSVSWVDCTSTGENLGRGLFMAGNFTSMVKKPPPKLPLAFPMDAPAWVLNRFSIRAFNALYYGKQRKQSVRGITHFEPFFYPLDSIHDWNKMYGKRGFFQYQLVVPYEGDRKPIVEVFERITASGKASFLAVLKTFGSVPSPGLMSFPMPGVTLALDFPNDGEPVLKLLEDLDAICRDAKGRVYPGKDARMSPQSFRAYYPMAGDFAKYIDPKFSSSFWRRVTES